MLDLQCSLAINEYKHTQAQVLSLVLVLVHTMLVAGVSGGKARSNTKARGKAIAQSTKSAYQPTGHVTGLINRCEM